MTEIKRDNFVLNPPSVRRVYITITESHRIVNSVLLCYKEEHF